MLRSYFICLFSVLLVVVIVSTGCRPDQEKVNLMQENARLEAELERQAFVADSLKQVREAFVADSLAQAEQDSLAHLEAQKAKLDSLAKIYKFNLADMQVVAYRSHDGLRTSANMVDHIERLGTEVVDTGKYWLIYNKTIQIYLDPSVYKTEAQRIDVMHQVREFIGDNKRPVHINNHKFFSQSRVNSIQAKYGKEPMILVYTDKSASWEPDVPFGMSMKEYYEWREEFDNKHAAAVAAREAGKSAGQKTPPVVTPPVAKKTYNHPEDELPDGINLPPKKEKAGSFQAGK